MGGYSAKVTYESKRMTIFIKGDKELVKNNTIIFDYNHEISGTDEVSCFVVETLVKPLLRGFDPSAEFVNFYNFDDVIYRSNKFQGIKLNEQSDCGSYWNKEENEGKGNCPILFFGGGKDSLLSSEIISELYRGKEKYLARLHMHSYPSGVEAREKKYQKNFQGYLEKKGFSSLEAKTNLFHDVVDKKLTNYVHAGLYPAAFAPLINNLEGGNLFFGFDAAEFYGRSFYRRGRPEVLNELGLSLSHAIGKPVKMRNINFSFTPFVAFKSLIRNSPEVFNDFVNMCETPREKWCHSCRKCFHYMIFSFACRQWPVGFNVKRFIDSSFFRAILDELQDEIDNNTKHYLSRSQRFAADRHYLPVLSCIKEIDMDWLSERFKVNPVEGEVFFRFLLFLESGISYFSERGFDLDQFNRFWMAAYEFERSFCNSFDSEVDDELYVINEFLSQAGVGITGKREVYTSIKGRGEKYKF